MKKITALVIALLIALGTFAQHTFTQFGLKGGVNLADLKMKTGNVDPRTAYNFGVLAHMHLSPHFALQPELIYSSQGAEINNNKLRLNYLNLPVLGQFMFGNGWRIQTGPQFGYRVNNNNSESGHTGNLNNTYKKIDFSWTLGAGYITRSGLGFDARYNYGLNDISKNNSGIRNRVWQLGLLYQFGK